MTIKNIQHELQNAGYVCEDHWGIIFRDYYYVIVTTNPPNNRSHMVFTDTSRLRCWKKVWKWFQEQNKFQGDEEEACFA